MSALKPWHTLIIGLVIGFAVAKKTGISVPILG
jgi:hypothetical protein